MMGMERTDREEMGVKGIAEGGADEATKEKKGKYHPQHEYNHNNMA